MIRKITALLAIFAVCSLAVSSLADTKKGEKIDGKKEFDEHCAVCHPEGGNIINRAKTLHKKDREANGVKKAGDIVQKMRKPGPGMTPFDKKTISDKEAGAIADYIIKSF
jgi:cytochrome c6